LNRQIENTFSQADWDNTTRSIPDMDALLDARKNLSEQFPDSSEEAIFQAQDALFNKRLRKSYELK
jgi:predicted RNase H-like nuclease